MRNAGELAFLEAQRSKVASEIEGVSFSFFDTNEIKKISMKQINNPQARDELGHALNGGLNDAALGPDTRDALCKTCGLDYYQCPGHFGHIELAGPVYNPLLFPVLFVLYRSACLYCHHFQAQRLKIKRYAAMLALIEAGLIEEAKALDSWIEVQRVARLHGLAKEDVDKGGDKEGVTADVKGESADVKGTATFAPSVVSAAGMIRLIGEYVADAFKRHRLPRTHVAPKNLLANDFKRSIIRECIKALGKAKCENCGAYNNGLRKDGHAKLFRTAMSRRNATQMAAQGLVAPDVLVELARELVPDSGLRLPTPAARQQQQQQQTTSSTDSLKRTAAQMASPEADSSDETDESSSSSSEEDEDNSEEEDEEEREETSITGDGLSDEKKAKAAKQMMELTRQRYVYPAEVYGALRRVFRNERELLMLIFGSDTVDGAGRVTRTLKAEQFFMEVVPVIPNRYRPVSILGDQTFEHPMDTHLNAILRANGQVTEALLQQREISVQAALEGKAPPKESLDRLTVLVINGFVNLQHGVNSLVDSNKSPVRPAQGTVPPAGIKQILEKKEGLFRMNMMGKRVNYAARTVISPDPNLETSEIGVPLVFARKLTFAEPVTEHNFQQLRAKVINGPNRYPGADSVLEPGGAVVSLAAMDETQRTAVANALLAPSAAQIASADGGATPKRVFRHLQNGDLVLLNRQPTLHKPSIMSHRAKVLSDEKTFRMHYANCNTYNADFDGDEMNMHFPQTQQARAEALLIMNTDNQYLKPTDGSPLRGLIQDHVVMGVRLSQRDTFLSRAEYMQLLFGILPQVGARRLRLLPPAVQKPVPLWTGKQVVSTLLLNLRGAMEPLNLVCKTQVPARAWGSRALEEDAQVVFMDGLFLTGVLDKSQQGAKSFGLVHAVYELYGAPAAGHLLTALGRLFTRYTQMVGFTCRMDDLGLTPAFDARRKALVRDSLPLGELAAEEFCEVARRDAEGDAQLHRKMEETLRDDLKLKALDGAYKTRSGEAQSAIINTCIPDGLFKKFPFNNMQLMTVSGAKGSNVNVSQISGCLGQQELEGRRVPVMVSGKTLPSFRAFDLSLRAGGFISGRFLTGIRPQEYYFHCMAGREGLIDTAVKTASSGYLQRCLIKHLEGLRVQYDGTVRDADGSLLQFHYGEDSLDVIKQSYLNNFAFNILNADGLLQKYNPNAASLAMEDAEELHRRMKRARKHPEKHDPAISAFAPARYFGATSEKFAQALLDYASANPAQLLCKSASKRRNERQLSSDKFLNLMNLKYAHCLVDAGEAVGLLAAQGVGEPSTQMTLNTFHFAGFGAKNVTLGIPRLREIVMTASRENRTPVMTCRAREGVTEEQLRALCLRLSRIAVQDCIREVKVAEALVAKAGGPRRVYKIRLELVSREITERLGIQSSDVLRAIAAKFCKKLGDALKGEVSRSRVAVGVEAEAETGAGPEPRARKAGPAKKRPKTSGGASDDDDDEDDLPEIDARPKKGKADGGHPLNANDDEDDEDEEESVSDEEADEDATKQSQRKKKQQMTSYEKDEDAEGAEEMSGSTSSSSSESDSDDSDDSDSGSSIANSEDAEREDLRGELRGLAIRANPFVSTLAIDEAEHAWCEVTLTFPANTRKLLMLAVVEKVLQKVVVKEIEKIKSASVVEPESAMDKSLRIGTDGVNLHGIWDHGELLDLNTLESNNIFQLLQTYGVEAARAAIVQEIRNVFGVYGIGVDARHLSLIADYMTFEGGYKPFNRQGINSNASPFAKMSFETTMQFLTDAAMYGDADTLRNPSSRIVMGKVVEGGTGAFDVLNPLVL